MTDVEFMKLIKARQGCCDWPYGTTADGYGSVRYQGKTWRANRLAYYLTKGPIPDNMGVLHTCDNKLCINPEHLYIGDQKDNVKDALYRSPSFGTSKLSIEDVKDILLKHYVMHIRDASIAREYGVSQTAITQIVKGRHYPDIFVEVLSELSTLQGLDSVLHGVHSTK